MIVSFLTFPFFSFVVDAALLPVRSEQVSHLYELPPPDPANQIRRDRGHVRKPVVELAGPRLELLLSVPVMALMRRRYVVTLGAVGMVAMLGTMVAVLGIMVDVLVTAQLLE